MQRTRKEKERARHRRQVLEAAEELFSRKGFHETTVQDIAVKSEFAVGTLYNMFENKSDLYYEIVRMKAGEYMDSVKKDLRSMADPRDQLKAIMRAKFDFFHTNRQFFTIFSRVLFEAPGECSLILSEEGRRIYEEYMDLLTALFSRGVEEGCFADVDPQLLTLSFEGITRQVISEHLLASEAPPSERFIDGVERVLFRGILK